MNDHQDLNFKPPSLIPSHSLERGRWGGQEKSASTHWRKQKKAKKKKKKEREGPCKADSWPCCREHWPTHRYPGHVGMGVQRVNIRPGQWSPETSPPPAPGDLAGSSSTRAGAGLGVQTTRGAFLWRGNCLEPVKSCLKEPSISRHISQLNGGGQVSFQQNAQNRFFCGCGQTSPLITVSWTWRAPGSSVPECSGGTPFWMLLLLEIKHTLACVKSCSRCDIVIYNKKHTYGFLSWFLAQSS